MESVVSEALLLVVVALGYCPFFAFQQYMSSI
jgi:hypothetical protein